MSYKMHCECYININTEEIAKCELCEAALDLYEALKHTQTVLYNLKVTNLGELTQQQRLLEIEVVKALAKAEGKALSNL